METNRRLENLQSILENVLTNLSGNDAGQHQKVTPVKTPNIGENSAKAEHRRSPRDGKSADYDFSEEWWDEQCKTSEDDAEGVEENVRRSNVIRDPTVKVLP